MTQSNSESKFLVLLLRRKIINNAAETHTLDLSTGSLRDPRRLEEQSRYVAYTPSLWDSVPVFCEILFPPPCLFTDGDEIVL